MKRTVALLALGMFMACMGANEKTGNNENQFYQRPCTQDDLKTWNSGPALPSIVETDVCIYGATSGGVVSAVTAARQGKSVVIVEPGSHVGGMSTSGLSFTDTGLAYAIGGTAREFYRKVGKHYNTSELFEFEPHAAEDVFKCMLNQAQVRVGFQEQIDQVVMQGLRITQITMKSGRMFRAKMFIDSSYEGDLMALAKVSYTVGRESNSTYGESLNGNRIDSWKIWVDPYVVPGDASSGLLPHITLDDGIAPGQGDSRIQAYTYRLCLTKDPANQIPIAPPNNYNPAEYALLARIIAYRRTHNMPLSIDTFLTLSPLPNGKIDMNSSSFFSTDCVGMNDGYPEASMERRAEIALAHENYVRGILTFLRTDPSIPADVQREINQLGLCKDEFQDTGGWSYQMYLRETRRMVSDHVMTQADCEGRDSIKDVVAYASYGMDSHGVRRIVRGDALVLEGSFLQQLPKPYPISYRSIVPRVGECENLFVTSCLSASHVAFSSCRMEPVFMILGQSAATAASIAIDNKIPVQKVNYQTLQTRMLADKQVI